MVFKKTIPIKDCVVDHYFNKVTVRLNNVDDVVSVRILENQEFHYDRLKSKLTIMPSKLTHRLVASKNDSVEIEYMSVSEERDYKIKEIIG